MPLRVTVHKAPDGLYRAVLISTNILQRRQVCQRLLLHIHSLLRPKTFLRLNNRRVSTTGIAGHSVTSPFAAGYA